MPTPSGFPTSQDLINAQKDVEHLGRVVNSEDTQGNPLASSTNRTGGVNKTLDALQTEYQSAIQAAGGVPLGTWSSGTTYNAYNEYLVYNGIPYKPAASTTLPYTTQGADPTASPDAGLVVPFAEVQASDLVTVREDLLGPDTQLFMGDDGDTVKVGDTVPAGTTHLRVEIGGSPALVVMLPVATGSVTTLSATGATIGGVSVFLVDANRYKSWRGAGDIRGWGASTESTPQKNREAIQSAMDESFRVVIPNLNEPFEIDRPIRPNSYQMICGGGEVKNITVHGLDPTESYLDSFVMLNKEGAGDVRITTSNWDSLNTRYAFVDYKAGDFYRLNCSDAPQFSVGEFVIIESTDFISDSLGLPKNSFVTKISEVGVNYLSLHSSHRLDIGPSTIRSLSGYAMSEGVTIKNVTFTGSYYVGEGQFGGFGGLFGYNHHFEDVKINGGIGYSVNFLHSSRIENCTVNAEFTGIEEALLSSNNNIIDNQVNQRAGFVSDSFGKNGNGTSNGIMSAEGARGSIFFGNDVRGNWYHGIFFKKGSLPFDISNNKTFGGMYGGYSFTDEDVDCTFSNNTATLRGTDTYGVLSNPGVSLRGSQNLMDVDSIGYVLNQSVMIGDRNDSTAPIKTRLQMSNNIDDNPSQYIETQDKLIANNYYSSGRTVEISTINGVLFEQSVDAGSVCQKGVSYELEAHFSFETSISRTININIGATSASFNTTGSIVHINANIINSIDSGAVGYGLGAVKLVCDGVTQQAKLNTYPTAVWDGSPVRVSVVGGGQVSERFFKSTFENNFCVLL